MRKLCPSSAAGYYGLLKIGSWPHENISSQYLLVSKDTNLLLGPFFIRNINLSFSNFHFSAVMRNDVCMQFTQMVVNSIPNLRPTVRLFEHEFATK